MRFFNMSMETATQRLNTALAGLETKVAQRLEGLQAEHARLRQDYDALQAEAKQMRATLEASAATVTQGVSAASYAALEKRNADYRTALTKTLHNLDTLITRVESAAK
jgi:Skp family chaperone for outer membrane proteins